MTVRSLGVGVVRSAVPLAHRATNGADKYHLENMANVQELPESGAFLIVAPIKIAGGSGGQVRIFGVIPDEDSEGR